MRGLELYESNVRRELQKHYARSIIEAQRRIKARSKRKHEADEDSVLLQRVAEKYSQYARDRAFQIAARDEMDSRRVHEEAQPQLQVEPKAQLRMPPLIENHPPSKKQCLHHSKPQPTSPEYFSTQANNKLQRGAPQQPFLGQGCQHNVNQPIWRHLDNPNNPIT